MARKSSKVTKKGRTVILQQKTQTEGSISEGGETVDYAVELQRVKDLKQRHQLNIKRGGL